MQERITEEVLHPTRILGLDQVELRARYNWKEVENPVSWDPKENEELVGFYGGQTIRQGPYGEYTVAIVHIPQRGSMIMSGAKLINLLDACQVIVGHPIRIKFLGWVELDEERKMKDYQVFIADGPSIDPRALPEVGTH